MESSIDSLINFKDKYNKYFNKYHNQLNKSDVMDGGKKKTKKINKLNKIIIHVSGPSGSGKSTLGNKLKEKFGRKIVVKDMDDLRNEFIVKKYPNKRIESFDSEGYQKYIDKYLTQRTKPVILVGLNHLPWFDYDLYYDVHANYKFFIVLDDLTVIKQKCSRFLDDIADRKGEIIDRIIKDEEKTIGIYTDALAHECSYSEVKTMGAKWLNDYKSQGYKMEPRAKIFSEISKILNKLFK